jgi:energy-coupling factor transporter ATP-binding protein EcfA2
MYLRRAHLQNVKCFEDVDLRFESASETGDRQSNWNVIIGENGDGKTSLLQAIAACLMDATTADRLLKPSRWVRRDASDAKLGATLIQEPGTDTTLGPPAKNQPHDRMVEYRILNAGEQTKGASKTQFLPTATIVEPGEEYRALFGDDLDRLVRDIDFLKRNAFSRDRLHAGWFSAGYGPFRRVSGASESTRATDDPLEKRFLTLFEEGAALIDCERWLKELERLALKSRKGSAQRATLADCKALIVKLLPEIEAVDIKKEVELSWHRHPTDLGGLSDGYRAMFVLIVDILRWLEATRPKPSQPLHEGRGVVLIDEIDTHLHPKWQRQAGFLLCETFPNLQFIVTSHSPFVAMAAGQSALTLLEREDDLVRANQDLPYVRGWAADQILTQLFGLVSLRDPETEEKLETYERLRTRRRRGEITPGESTKLDDLERYLNERLAGESESPKNQALDEDLTLLRAQSKGLPGRAQG